MNQGLKHQTIARFFTRLIHLKANKFLVPLFLFKQDFITKLHVGPCYFSIIWFIGWPKNIIVMELAKIIMVLITIYFCLGKLEPVSNVAWCEMYSLQVLSDILVDRINYRVMTSVYHEIKGGWTLRQKIREQVSYFILFFDKKRSHTCTAVTLWITMDSTICRIFR